MKNLIILLLFNSFILYSQVDKAVWPIDVPDIEKSILYKPQDYIENEFNYDNLFITGTENTRVTAPVSGTISAVLYFYHTSLTQLITFNYENGDDEQIRQHLAQKFFDDRKIHIDPQFISLTIGIKTANGSTYYISGLRPENSFRTGYAIKQGEIMGKMGYVYKPINKPAICISRSVHGKSADPMSPFGLPTTFKEPVIRNPEQKLSVEDLKQDFMVFRSSLEEGHPGLYDYTDKATLDSLFDVKFNLLTKPMTSGEFADILYPVISAIKDGHTQLLNDNNHKGKNQKWLTPSVYFGLWDDTLVVTRTTTDYSGLLGKHIHTINNVDADTIIKRINKEVRFHAEGNIESIADFQNRTIFWSPYLHFFPPKAGDSLHFKFYNHPETKVPYDEVRSNACIPHVPDWNYMPKNEASYSSLILNDSTAYLDINTFSLTTKDEDEITEFIKEISDSSVLNLIIDLRYNTGGSSDCLDRIFALIAHEPFQSSYTKVNSNKGFEFFKHTTNYPASAVLFPEYIQLPGKDGYYDDPALRQATLPNDTINFQGNVFVLTNERTFSAASMFAALVHKYKRGIIIGRETASVYHQMVASKFAHVFLFHSGRQLRMPLVKIVFDEPENSDIPFGRGVIPDYEIKLSTEELIDPTSFFIDSTIKIITYHNTLIADKAEILLMQDKKNNLMLIAGSIALGLFLLLSFIYFTRIHLHKTEKLQKLP
jgi:hypothetical protein